MVAQQDSIAITNNKSSIDLLYKSDVKYTFVKNNIQLEKYANDIVYIYDGSGRYLKINYLHVKSPVVVDANALFALLISYRDN